MWNHPSVSPDHGVGRPTWYGIPAKSERGEPYALQPPSEFEAAAEASHQLERQNRTGNENLSIANTYFHGNYTQGKQLSLQLFSNLQCTQIHTGTRTQAPTQRHTYVHTHIDTKTHVEHTQLSTGTLVLCIFYLVQLSIHSYS